MTRPTTLWMVRHALPVPADPAHPASAFCYGRTDWPAHAPETLQAAERLTRALTAAPHQPLAHPGPKVLRCSPRQRCWQLAQHLLTLRPDWTCVVDERLAEMDFGQWEGLAWTAIDRSELDAWADNFTRHRVGQTGETVRAFVHRVADAARQAMHPEHPDTLWVTHAGVIRAMQWLCHSPSPQRIDNLSASDWPAWAPACGDWAVLDTTSFSRATCPPEPDQEPEA